MKEVSRVERFVALYIVRPVLSSVAWVVEKTAAGFLRLIAIVYPPPTDRTPPTRLR